MAGKRRFRSGERRLVMMQLLVNVVDLLVEEVHYGIAGFRRVQVGE